jgi:hypothetical protein
MVTFKSIGLLSLQLVKQVSFVTAWKSKGWLGDYLQSQAIGEYEAEMRERATWSIIKSSQACVDAHDWAVATGGRSAMWERRTGLVRHSIIESCVTPHHFYYCKYS